MTRRAPWPWEPPAPEYASGQPVKAAAADLLAAQPDTGASTVGGGELRNRVSVRETRAQLYRDALAATDGTPAAQEWAHQKADRAIRYWDRGVRAGTITQADRG